MIDCKNISYTYPFQEKKALDALSFSIKKGEIVLCTGVSGSGKSTLMRIINGLCPHFFKGTIEGSIHINGSSLSGMSLQSISSLVGSVFQDPENQFFALTVEDELAFTLEMQGIDPIEIARKIKECVEFFGLESILHSSVYEISEGEKQKLAIAAQVINAPKILVLDEPTANLDPETMKELGYLLQKLQNIGMTIFIVDHRLYWLSTIADRVLIMESGKIVKDIPFEALADKSLQERYGLRSNYVQDIRASLNNISEESPLCSMENIDFSYNNKPPMFSNLNINFYKGITAIYGKNGVGKTTLTRILAGLEKPEKGSIIINGTSIPRINLLHSISIVLQNMSHQLYMQTVYQEVLFAKGLVMNDAIKKEVDIILEQFHLSHVKNRHPQSLSGGEKQRLVLVCALIKSPRIIILDEPTSGLDGRNMKHISTVLQELGKEHVVLIITHDLELIQNICTRAINLEIYR